MLEKITVTEWINNARGLGMTQLEALDALVWLAYGRDRTFYSGDGHPIPQSSYRPRKGVL
jgi:hypothetical protein